MSTMFRYRAASIATLKSEENGYSRNIDVFITAFWWETMGKSIRIISGKVFLISSPYVPLACFMPLLKASLIPLGGYLNSRTGHGACSLYF